MSDVVLDATALLALLLDQPGGRLVEERLPQAMISSVGLAEVAARLADRGMPVEEIRSVLDALGVEVVSFDAEMAYASAELGPTMRQAGISLGGRATLALGRSREAVVLTANRDWSALDVGVQVEVVD